MPLSEEFSRTRRQCSQVVTTNREKSAEVIVGGKVKNRQPVKDRTFNQTSIIQYFMEGIMQKIAEADCPRRNRTASEGHEGVQTFM